MGMETLILLWQISSNNVSILKNRNRSADITLSSSFLSFGDVSVGGSRSLYLRIYNDGVDSALVGRISLSSGRSFSLSKNSFTIPGLGVDSVLVSFSPVGYGNWVDTLIIESNDPVKPRLFVKLVGYSSYPEISLIDSVLQFGDVSVGSRRSLYLKIRNKGINELIGNIVLSDSRSFSLSKNSFSIPGLGVDSVLVSFSPIGYGNWVDTLIIESNDPVKPRLFVKLVGYSGNYVSGVITSDAVWRRDNSPYIISGNVGVDAGVRLRIEPGVVVVFKGRYSILVDGKLEVYGVEGDSVLFTSLYPDTIRGDWIYFRSGSRGDINYAIFEYGNIAIRANGAVGVEVRGSRFSFNGVGMSDTSVSSVLVSGVKFSMNGTGLSLYNSGVNVEGSEFRGNSTGVSIGGGNVVISGSRIVGNSGYGVYNGYYGYGNVKVIGSELVGNGTGFYNSWSYGWIDIYGNVVRGNVGWGFELHGVSGLLRRNVIEGNGGGVWVDNNVEISDNVIVRNRGRGVYVDGGVNVLRNRVSLNFDDGIYSGGNSQIKYNDITYNGGDGIETAGLPLVNYNNIFGNVGYDFRATKVSPDSINARYNWWGTTDRDSIAGKIYDYYDDVNLVKVRFEPYYSSFVEMVPVSGFRAVGLSGGRVRLSWDRNSFASRYRIYWDNGGGVIDTVNVWVELDSSYTSYEAVLVDGLYKFGIVAVSYDGRRSIMVVDSVVADGTAPRLLYAFGVSGDSTISVKFSEPVKYDIVSDTGRWEFWGGIKVKSVFPKFVKGLEVRYYNGRDFKNLVRKDTIRSGNMSFDWGYGSPASGVSSDTFSVRFSGYIYIPVSGSYNFYVECDDWVKLIIGNDTLIYYGGYGSSVSRSFSPGLYRFIFEFVEDYGYAYFRLYWTVPGGSRVLMSVDNFMVNVDFSAYNLKLAGVLPVADTLVYVKVRGVEDFYGNRAGELRYDFYPDDGNSNPVVELISRIVEASSDIRVDYRISDVEGDVVRIRVEYSIDGGRSWRVGSVVGDTVDIGRDRYVGYIVWRSGEDLPGYDGEVIFRVTPRDNDPHNWGTPGEIRFRVDNYQRQKIKIALVDTLFEYSDSVKISYLIEDSTKDVLEIKVFYVKGLDSARVGSIGGVPSKVDSSRYRGTFIWLSKKDLDGFDGNVKLYVYASDGWGNGLGDSLSFKLDNNEIPSIAIAPIGEEVNDSVRIRYVLTDREGDTLRISFEYSLDSLRWRRGKVLGDTIIPASGYASNIIWLSRSDLPGVDDIVYVKITPFDNDTGRAGVISIHLDNNYPPVAKIDSISGLKRRTGAYRGDISFSFNLRDAEGDSVKIYFKFRYDSPDSIWRVATASGVQRVVAPGVYSGVWHTTDDLPFASGRYVFGIFPEDKDAGVYDSVIVNVDNIGVPAVISLSIFDTSKIEFSGNITFNYRVIDEEGDTIRLRFDYSVDGGRSWRRAIVLGDTILSDSSRYVGSIIWRSEADLWGVDVDSVLFRLTPYDRNMGLQYISKPFHLDNNEPPRVVMTRLVGEQSDSVRISFNVGDRERDSVMLVYEYSVDGRDWRKAKVVGYNSVDSSRYSGFAIWLSRVDLPDVDLRVYFRITPYDKDRGIGDSIYFSLDNYQGQKILISFVDSSSELSDSVKIRYTVIDTTKDTLRILGRYSIDGVNWKYMTLSGSLGVIDTSRYNGVIVWLSKVDLPFYDGLVTLRFDISDGWGFGKGDSVKFHLDNNEPPRVVMTRLVGEQSDSVRISFNVGDRERDSVMLVYEYSVDGRDWRKAKVVGYNSVDSSRYSGFAIWLSRVDLPDVDLRVYFRITPYDKDRGIGDSIYFSLDNYQGQKILISFVDSSSELSDSVKIRYTVIDATKDTLRILGRYSIDGVNWKYMTLSGSLGVIDTSRYNGVIVWLSKVDLPFYDGLVTLRFDISDGWGFGKGDSVKFHLDNNEPPRITYIETPKVEVVGSYSMKFISWDREGDTVKFIYEFMVEGDTSWRKATAGNLSKVGDTTIVIWRTDIDLFNRDVYVYFKVTPMDNDTGKAMTTGRFKVDNQTGPILISSSPLNVAFYNDTIVFKFDRKVRYNSVVSALNITGTRTGVHSFSITPSVDDSMFYVVAQPFFASAETVLISLSGDFANGVKDLLGNSLDGNKNGDPEGSPDDDIKISFVTSLLGDFNLDRRVNLSDLNEFRKVWNGQIRHREIGPALGKPPQMIPQPDGKVDFEDLMVFVMNWNWTTRSGGFKLASKFGITDNGAGIASISLPIENKKGDVISAKFDEEMVKLVKLRNKNEYIRVGEVENDLVTYKVALSFPDSITALEVVLRYNPGILRVLEVKDLKAFDLVNGGRNVFLSYIDSVNGLIVVDVANFGKIDKVGEIEIASLTFSTQTKDETDVLLACEVITGRGEVYDITRVAKVSTKPEIPTRFELLQNFPNPFNPLTVIRFHVPQRSRVKIKIYDIIGREVSVPIDGEFDAGYYEFVWDSKDGSGKEVASGVYFYVMEAFGGNELLFRQIKKMVIVK
jgi:hypothetical protein